MKLIVFIKEKYYYYKMSKCNAAIVDLNQSVEALRNERSRLVMGINRTNRYDSEYSKIEREKVNLLTILEDDLKYHTRLIDSISDKYNMYHSKLEELHKTYRIR